MPLRWKIDITESLKVKGYSSYKIRKEKLFGQKTLQDFRDGTVVLSYDLLEKLCALLECQPGDLLEYVASKDDDSEYVYDCGGINSDDDYAVLSGTAEIQPDRMDKFTSDAGDFEIIKPAPKKQD